MNYRDYFKRLASHEADESLIPEGVDPKEFDMGVKDERGEHDGSDKLAQKLAHDHLKKDPHYYSKLKSVGLEQDECGMEQDECATCGCGDPTDDHSHEEEFGDEGFPHDDFNGGLPKLGGALSVPHRGQPIMMGKVISVGPIGKGPSSGELSGYTNVGGSGASGKGVAKDQGGVEVGVEGGEPITAGGKKVDAGIATKSVGGEVSPGEGQRQGGKNSVGTIADTPKLTEAASTPDDTEKSTQAVAMQQNKPGDMMELIKKYYEFYASVYTNKEKSDILGLAKYAAKADADEYWKRMGKDPALGYHAMPATMIDRLKNDETKIAQRATEHAQSFALAGGKVKQQYTGRYGTQLKTKYEPKGEPAQPNQSGGKYMGAKKSIREQVKQILKEVCFNKETGKWVRIDEGGHKAGCTCAFCKNKGTFGKKKKEDKKKEKSEEMDENTVDMKIGPSYKVVQPRQYKVMDDDFARTNQYDPEITEMYDEEEECMMNERYAELVNAGRNLSENEITEMNKLSEKIEQLEEKKKWIQKAIKHPGRCTPMSKPGCTGHAKALAKRFKSGDLSEKMDAAMKMGPSYRVVPPTQARTIGDDNAHRNQDTPDMSESGEPTGDMQLSEEEIQALMKEDPMDEAGIGAVQHSSMRTVGNGGNLPQKGDTRWADDLDEVTKKVSKVAKTLQKGMKAKKTKKNPKLKFQPTKHTTSGVHKRKTK